jgi:succinate---hydroxymethylglutarate CoA-transferase
MSGRRVMSAPDALTRSLPLHGVRVVELAHVAAGPFTASVLADLGADVVKIEPPSGDAMRAWPPLVEGDSGERFSGNFASLNRNKRSVVNNLKQPEQLAEARRLCDRADVLIENYRPGALAELGLGYERLRTTNPGLVYCSISGYGQSGAHARQAAYDVTVQAVAGLMSVTGEKDGPAAKCGVPVADFVTGLYAAVSILAALRQRGETGAGCHIDCSMVGSLLGISALQTSEMFGTGIAPRRLGTAHPRNAPYQAFRGSDRPFIIAAGNDRMWLQLCSTLGRDDLAADPRFASQELRAAHQHELADLLAPEFAKARADHWCNKLSALGIATAPINDFKEALEDPHVADLGLMDEVVLPNGTVQQTLKFPVTSTTFSPVIYRQPPALGHDHDSVIEDWLSAAPQAEG